MNERQKMLLEIAVQILDDANEYSHIVEDNQHLLKYDDATQDIGCLADDIRIEFNLD